MGGTTRLADSAPNRKFIRALDIQTGRTVWSYAQSGEARTFSGVLSTDGDVVFFGENSGSVRRAGRAERRAALARPDQPGMESLADDVHGRRPAVRRHRVQAWLLGVRAALTSNVFA